MDTRKKRPNIANDLKTMSIFISLILLLLIFSNFQPWPVPMKITGGDKGPPSTHQSAQIEYLTEEVLSVSGQTTEGSSTDKSLDLPMAGVTVIEAALTWSDDIGDNDILRLTIIQDGQELTMKESDSGTIFLKVSSDTEAGLTGNYTLRITAVSCPGLVTPIPVDRDNGNAWDLSVDATFPKEVQ